MKIRIAMTLFALVLASAAGIAWAAQPAVESTTDAPAVEAPAPEGDIVPAQLEDLFVEPADQYGGCCWADCDQERTECYATCTDGPCGCAAEFQACVSRC